MHLRFKPRLRFSVRTFLLLVLLSGPMVLADERPDHRAKILERLKALENISVRYRRGDRYYPRADSPKVRTLPGGGKMVLLTEPEDYICEFRHFQGRALYSRQRLGEVPEGGVKQLIYAFSADRQESLIESEELRGGVERDRRLPALEYIDIAIGLRAYGADAWLTAERLKSAEIEVLDNRISLSWLDGVRFAHVYDFDPKLGYALVGYTRTGRGQMLSRIENLDFRRIDEVFLPFKSVYTKYRSEDGRMIPSLEVIMNMDEYVLGDERNRNDDFRIEWPLTSYVTHHELKVSVQVMSRPQKLDDAIFNRAAGRD